MTMSDVWELETPMEKLAKNTMEQIILRAMKGNKKSQNYLRKLWGNESWQSIKAKLEVEGSAWYVWYMDGVRQHLSNLTEAKA